MSELTRGHATTVINAESRGMLEHIKAVYNYRHLIWVFARRELGQKYAQTFLGFAWAVLQPLLTLTVFAFFFGILLKVDTSPVPYVLFVLSGILIWYNFSAIVNGSGIALIQASDMVSKIYFPRMTILLSKVLTSFVELGVMLVLVVILFVFFGFEWRLSMLFFPVCLLLIAFTGLSAGIWLAALTVRFRDLQHIIPYLVGFGIFITPVFFPVTLVPEAYHYLIYLNPVAGIIEAGRWCLWGGSMPEVQYLWGFIPMFILLLSGIAYFFKIEDSLSDIL